MPEWSRAAAASTSRTMRALSARPSGTILSATGSSSVTSYASKTSAKAPLPILPTS